MKYVVMRNYRDGHGTLRHERVTMRAYTEPVAVKKANEVRGGYVCPLGSNNPVYVGLYR